jgi:hypothetical protein
MAFHKDKAGALKWKRWLEHSRAALVACGLPEEVYADRRSWLYFLGHAGLHNGATGFRFDPKMLNRGQIERLYAFLTADHSPCAYDPHLVTVLRGELGIPQTGCSQTWSVAP